MPDPYQTLGVTRSVSAEELKSSYRKLAKKYHPDLNPGRKDIEQKFKEVTAAYDLLSDPDKRARFDRGEIDNMGNERGYTRGGGDPFGGMGGAGRGRSYSQSSSRGSDPFGGLDADDIFAEFFSNQTRGRGGQARAQRGGDVNYALTVPFGDAALGSKQRVTLSTGKTIEVNIPPGTDEGHKLRLRGQGMPGAVEAGDAIIEVHVEPHPYLSRKGDDIYIDAPISLPEALMGASIKVPTMDGQVSVKIPKGANSGATLRLKGKGIPKAKGDYGDMFVKVKIMIPEPPDPELVEFIEKWSKKYGYDPRRKLGWDVN